MALRMTARPTTRYHNKVWGSSIVSIPTFRPSTYSSGLDTSGTSSHRGGFALNLWHCPYDYMCIALAVLYFLLMVRCVVLAREHHGWSNRQAQGLIWYLLCSLLMCACRMACFIMVPFLSLDCDSSYRVWAWETDGLAFGAVPWSAWPTSPTTTSTTSATSTSVSSKGGNKVDTTSSLSNYPSSSAHKGPVALALALLSSCALCLFFTSYTYFAHSLSRVLEMLTDHNNGSSGDSRILVLLLSLNICVWVSAGALALCLVASPQVQLYADSIARFSIALAAFCTSASFSLLFARALVFLWRQQENRDVGRAAQLTRLFRVRRIRGVLAVCTVVFLVRALVLVLHSHLTSLPFWSWAELVYLVLVEGAPTLYMLNAFRSSSLADAAAGSMTAAGAKSPMNEFDVLKATLTSNLSVVSSPARTGFTSRYYATPEKSSVQSAQDAEERCRLLHTPGSEMSGFGGGGGGGGGLDPLELERGAELYRL